MPDNQQPANDLQTAYWFTTHRLFLRRLLFIFLIGFITITFLYTFWQLIVLYLIQYNSYQQMLLELPLDLVNYQGFNEEDKPRDLVVLSTTVLGGTQNRYDMLVNVSNANPKWYTEFDYQFLSDGLKSQPHHAFILPGEQKYLVDLGVESAKAVRQPIFNITNQKWKKVLNFKETQADKFKFKIDNIGFTSAGLTEISGKVPISKTTFNITNQSAYNFWSVGVYVVLYTGTRIVGVNYITLDKFQSLETRPVEINWFDSLGNVTKTDIVPEVDILDPSVYMEFQGAPPSGLGAPPRVSQ